jgi:hypothetical protein
MTMRRGQPRGALSGWLPGQKNYGASFLSNNDCSSKKMARHVIDPTVRERSIYVCI